MKKMGEKAKIISCLAIIIVSLIIIFALKAGDGDSENEINETKKKFAENETTTKKKIDDNENETKETTEKVVENETKETNKTIDNIEKETKETNKTIDNSEKETNKTIGNSENESNDTIKEIVENETTTNKTTDDNDIFIPDVAEKEIIKKSLDISKSTTDDEIIAIFGNDYTIEIINEEYNFKKIEWSGIEAKNKVYIRLKDNKCDNKSISISLGNGKTKKTKITEELYYKLKKNLTYDDIKNILGEGTLSYVDISGWDDYGNQEISYIYNWLNENDTGILTISFGENLKSKTIRTNFMFKFYE